MQTLNNPVVAARGGWGEDVRLNGAEPGDVLMVTFQRAVTGSLPYTIGPLPVANNGDVQIRLDGEVTANWEPGAYDWEVTLIRGDAAGVFRGLPRIQVVDSLGGALAQSAPLVGSRGEKLNLTVSSRNIPGATITLLGQVSGAHGWTSDARLVRRGEDLVQQVAYIGGTGTKPMTDGWYVGAEGELVEDIADAVVIYLSVFEQWLNSLINRAGANVTIKSLFDRRSHIEDFEQYVVDGDWGPAFNAAASYSQSTKKMIDVDGGDFNILTPIAPVSDVMFRVGPSVRLIQKGRQLFRQADGTAISKFIWEGGLAIYDGPNDSKLDCMMRLDTFNKARITIDADDYRNQNIVHLEPTVFSPTGTQRNAVFNKFNLSVARCRKLLWAMGRGDTNTRFAMNGTTTTFTSDFNVNWPVDFFCCVLEAATGEFRLLDLFVDFEIVDGAEGTPGLVTVELESAGSAPNSDGSPRDIFYILSSNTNSPFAPVSNINLDFEILNAGEILLDFHRYVDAIRWTGRGTVTVNGGCDIRTNHFGQMRPLGSVPRGIGNQEVDYMMPHSYISGLNMPDKTTGRLFRFGPGTLDNRGDLTPDKAYPDAVFDVVDVEYVPLTGTVAISGTTATGVGTKFTEEIPTIGFPAYRLYIPSTGEQLPVVSVESNTQLTLLFEPEEDYPADTVAELYHVANGVNYDFGTTRSDPGGGQGPSRLRRKTADYAGGLATIKAGETRADINYRRLAREPHFWERYVQLETTGVSNTPLARIRGNRIKGFIELANATPVGVDLTFSWSIRLDATVTS